MRYIGLFLLALVLLCVGHGNSQAQVSGFGKDQPFSQDPFADYEEPESKKTGRTGEKDGGPPPPPMDAPISDHLWIVALGGLGLTYLYLKKSQKGNLAN